MADSLFDAEGKLRPDVFLEMCTNGTLARALPSSQTVHVDGEPIPAPILEGVRLLALQSDPNGAYYPLSCFVDVVKSANFIADTDAKVRVAALIQLEAAGRLTNDELWRALDDHDWEVKSHAMWLLMGNCPKMTDERRAGRISALSHERCAEYFHRAFRDAAPDDLRQLDIGGAIYTCPLAHEPLARLLCRGDLGGQRPLIHRMLAVRCGKMRSLLLDRLENAPAHEIRGLVRSLRTYPQGVPFNWLAGPPEGAELGLLLVETLKRAFDENSACDAETRGETASAVGALADERALQAVEALRETSQEADRLLLDGTLRRIRARSGAAIPQPLGTVVVMEQFEEYVRTPTIAPEPALRGAQGMLARARQLLRNLRSRLWPATHATLPPVDSTGRAPERRLVTRRVDRSQQVVRLEVPYAFYGSDVSEQLSPRVSDLLEPEKMVSASALAIKAKQFDDGLMAAVELALENGHGRLVGGNALLERCLEALPSSSTQARATLYAALRLRGRNFSVDPDVARNASAKVAEFLGDRARAHPIGVYSWSDDLQGIFRRDRFLQTQLPEVESSAMASALRQAEIIDDYSRLLQFSARLSNPFVESPHALTDAPPGAWLPPATSRDNETFAGNVDALVDALQRGTFSLEPSDDDGWYAHTLWALEPLVLCDQTEEARHLEFSPGYRDALLALFKALVALTRETHVKNFMVGRLGPAVRVKPRISVEPLVTHYRRRAASYRFISSLLHAELGDLDRLHRLTKDGPVSMPLDDELKWMELLFDGCARISAREIGLSAATDPADEQAADWLRTAKDDPDLSRDVRCMVPVSYDPETRKLRVMCVVGFLPKPLTASFVRAPVVENIDDRGVWTPVEIHLQELETRIIIPQAFVADVDDVMDREEFRKLCDEAGGTMTAIRARLAAC